MKKFLLSLIVLSLTSCGIQQEDSISNFISESAESGTIVLELPVEPSIPEEYYWILDEVPYTYSVNAVQLFDSGWELDYVIFEDYSTIKKEECKIQVAFTNPELLLTMPEACHVTAVRANYVDDSSEITITTSDGFIWKEYIQYCDVDLSKFEKTTQGLYTYYTKEFTYLEQSIRITYTVLNNVIMCIEFSEV